VSSLPVPPPLRQNAGPPAGIAHPSIALPPRRAKPEAGGIWLAPDLYL